MVRESQRLDLIPATSLFVICSYCGHFIKYLIKLGFELGNLHLLAKQVLCHFSHTPSPFVFGIF
jgi:hypothetical protein